MKRIVFAILSLTLSSCELSSKPTIASTSDTFVQLSKQRWGGWSLYVLKHTSGSCFVVLQPSGEGGGAITQADPRVCGDNGGQ